MTQEKINIIQQGLKNSFQNIKQDMENLKHQLTNNTNKISQLTNQNNELKQTVINLKQELILSKSRPQNNKLKTEMLNKIKRNKKTIIKSKILELIETERYSIPEIKEIIVNRDDYCSKATFYRYIKELNTIEEIKIGTKTIAVPIKEIQYDNK